MHNLLLVALGGAIGAVGRYLLGTQTLRAFGPRFPYGTLAANLLGGLMLARRLFA